MLASLLPCVLPEPQQPVVITTELLRTPEGTDALNEMLPSDTHLKKGLEVKTNETMPDGQIQSAPTVNVLADCLSMVRNADKNIGLLSLANVNKSIFPNCFSSSISLSSYLLCYRKITAELK